MKIASLQFAPRVGELHENIARANALLAAQADELEGLDLLVLPELAFSGYNFRSLEHITPFLEPVNTGPSCQWAKTRARLHNCAVIVGYPEVVNPSSDDPAGPERYNSAAVVMRPKPAEEPRVIQNYRKTFLYCTDDSWACEGKGFFGGELTGLGKVAMGICMDINPYKFEAPWTAYEFALYAQRLRAGLIILSMAWLTHDERTMYLSTPFEPDMQTLQYWLSRLAPILRVVDGGREVIVVFCNRCGVEDEVLYAGSSAVLGIKDGEVSLYGIMGRGAEGVLIADTEKAIGSLEGWEEGLDWQG